MQSVDSDLPLNSNQDFLVGKAGSPYTVETIVSEAALSDLETAWNRLSEAATAPNVFTTFGWFRAWYKRLAQDSSGRLRPHVLVLKRGNEVTGICPLVLWRRSRCGFVVRELRFVTEHADYNDLILSADQVGMTRAVAEYLAQTANEWDVANLGELRDQGEGSASLESALVHARLPYQALKRNTRCPYMPIDGTWSEMATKRHLYFARRAFAKFSASIPEGFGLRIVENPQREPGLLDRMISLEAQKHVGGELTLPFLGKYQDVFQSLFDTLGPSGWIAVVVVEWNNCLVAWRFLYRCGTRLWYYLSAYDHSLSKLSLGTISICAAIDYGYAHGFEELDFLRGEESYKLRWTSLFHENYRLMIWNRRWISRARKWIYWDFRAGILQMIGKQA